METHVPGRVLGDLKTGRWRVHGFFPRRSMWGAAWEPVSPPLWRGPVRLPSSSPPQPAASGRREPRALWERLPALGGSGAGLLTSAGSVFQHVPELR